MAYYYMVQYSSVLYNIVWYLAPYCLQPYTPYPDKAKLNSQLSRSYGFRIVLLCSPLRHSECLVPCRFFLASRGRQGFWLLARPRHACRGNPLQHQSGRHYCLLFTRRSSRSGYHFGRQDGFQLCLKTDPRFAGSARGMLAKTLNGIMYLCFLLETHCARS